MTEDSRDLPQIIELPQWFRDRDVFHDSDGRVYVTLGYIQPFDKIISYLKYVQDSKGRWRWGDTYYRRVFSDTIESVIDAFALIPPNYFVYDEHLGTSILEVPRYDVSRYFSPEMRLREILTNGPVDSVEERVMTLSGAIHDGIGIPYSKLGVTGSVSWKAHNPEWSDVNLNIYGLQEAWHLHANYATVADQTPAVQLRTGQDWSSSMAHLHAKIPRLSSDDITQLFERRIEFKCMDQYITVMPVLTPDEAPITHGVERYTPITELPIEVDMVIEEAKYGLFLPAIYEGVSQPIESLSGVQITRLMIYEGAFRGMFSVGDHVRISGMIQQVESMHESGMNSFFQVMVGTKNGAGREFIRIMN